MHWLAAALIAIAGLHTVASVGMTGGPSHGEHPFIVTLLHMGIFYPFSHAWPAFSRHLYWGGLGASLLLSIAAMNMIGDEYRTHRLIVRIPLGIIYAGFLLILFSKPA